MAQSILKRAEGGLKGGVISQTLPGQRLSDGQSSWPEPDSSYSEDSKGDINSEGQENQSSSVNKRDRGVLGAARAACQRFLSSCWTRRPNKAGGRVVAEASVAHRGSLQTVEEKNTERVVYFASGDHQPSEKLGVEHFIPHGDRTAMGRSLITQDLKHDSAQASESTVGAYNQLVSPVAGTTQGLLFCTCYHRQDYGVGLNQSRLHGTDVPSVTSGAGGCSQDDFVLSNSNGTDQADEYWEWDAEKQKYRHWDDDLGDWIVCPDEFD